MNQQEFEKLLGERIEKIDTVLGKKAAEYARGDDRLHNFKRVAQVKGCTVPEACLDGFYKHFISILDMIDDYKKEVYHSVELWDEKLGDAINYLILLEAILKEGVREKI